MYFLHDMVHFELASIKHFALAYHLSGNLSFCFALIKVLITMLSFLIGLIIFDSCCLIINFPNHLLNLIIISTLNNK